MRQIVYVLGMLLLFACGDIAVEPAPLPPPPPPAAGYDIAIVSVDFDPALQGNRLPPSSSYAVLVAVENRGTLTAYDVKVDATFTNTATHVRVMEDRSTIKELTPGAIKVVRFESLSKIPPAAAKYSLTVQSQPLPQELIVSNNVRNFKITVEP